MNLGKRLSVLTIGLVFSAAVIGGCGGAGGGGGSAEGGGTLTLGNIGWTENIAVSNLTKVLLEEELGYDEVELQTLDVGLLFQGVARGDLAAFQDVWLPNNENYLNKPQIEGSVELLDPWFEGETAYGIAVPDYMDVQSLADLDQAGTDTIVGIEPGASFHPVIRDEVIPGYDLDVELQESSTAGMLSELQRAYNNEEPIIFLGWSPHWMNQEYDFHYLEDPKDLQGAFNDPSRITTVVNEDLESDDPVAYAFLNSIRLTEEELNALENEIRQADDDAVAGSQAWLENNRDVVQPAVDAAKQAQE